MQISWYKERFSNSLLEIVLDDLVVWFRNFYFTVCHRVNKLKLHSIFGCWFLSSLIIIWSLQFYTKPRAWWAWNYNRITLNARNLGGSFSSAGFCCQQWISWGSYKSLSIRFLKKIRNESKYKIKDEHNKLTVHFITNNNKNSKFTKVSQYWTH